MLDRKSQNIVAVVIICVWAASFFVPAIYLDKRLPGYFAAFLSGFALYTAIHGLFSGDHTDLPYLLYVGSFCFANIFMIAAPFALRIARRGGGRTFLVLMTVWDALTLSWLAYAKLKGNAGSVLLGWWMWEASLICMTVFLLLVWHDARLAQPRNP